MSASIIAIDGPAGSGKSSVARALAAALGWSFLDTGAMYRAVTVSALEHGIDVHDDDAMAELAARVTLTTLPRVTVDGRDVEDEIRSDEVNVAVSAVAAIPAVRAQMVRRQREFAAAQPRGTGDEGRDITTVVFPNATVKIFLTASLAERTRRRGEEGEASLTRRDVADTTRDASPLRQASDALVLDTTGRSVDDVVEEVIECLKLKTSS